MSPWAFYTLPFDTLIRSNSNGKMTCLFFKPGCSGMIQILRGQMHGYLILCISTNLFCKFMV